MSTHPNAILLLILTPDGLARKTRREILTECKVWKYDSDGEIDEEGEITINGVKYHQDIMESDYDESYQISCNEGDIIIFDMVTYGYGEKIEWDKLEKQKTALEQWAVDICKKHNCSYKIYVTANYW